jgi:hypothetical protein
MIGTILLVFSFVLACLAASGWPPVARPHLGWAAFAFLVASLLFGVLGVGGSSPSPLLRHGGLRFDFVGTTALAQEAATPVPPNPVPPPVTQNTVTTTGPVSSETTISVGSMAAQVLMYVASAFATTVGTVLTWWLIRLLNNAGIQNTDLLKGQLKAVIVNGLNSAAAYGSSRLANRDPVVIKNQIVADAVRYTQDHGSDIIKKLGLDPQSGEAIEAIRAHIETAIADPTVPTPAVLATPLASAVPSPDYRLRPPDSPMGVPAR